MFQLEPLRLEPKRELQKTLTHKQLVISVTLGYSYPGCLRNVDVQRNLIRLLMHPKAGSCGLWEGPAKGCYPLVNRSSIQANMELTSLRDEITHSDCTFFPENAKTFLNSRDGRSFSFPRVHRVDDSAGATHHYGGAIRARQASAANIISGWGP